MDSMLINIVKLQMPTIPVYIVIAMGLLSCFLGYKLLRVWMAAIGFMIGMALGYFLSESYVQNIAVSILIGFLLGVLLGFIAYRIYLLGIFMIAFFTTFAFIGQLLTYYNELGWLWLIITLGLASVVAIMALKFARPVIIISTALNGAITAVIGVFREENISSSVMMILAVGLLALLGIIVQFITTKESRK